MSTIDLNTLSVMLTDHWLSADACAVFLGLVKDGEPNRRALYEKVANQPGFPSPLVIGGERKWRKSEVDLWSRDERLARQLADSPIKEKRHRRRKSKDASEPSMDAAAFA